MSSMGAAVLQPFWLLLFGTSTIMGRLGMCSCAWCGAWCGRGSHVPGVALDAACNWDVDW